MDFKENLSLRYSSLTKTGKEVADCFRRDPAKAVRMTAKELGAASGTSAASVIRFARKLGYESLEDMRIHLARSLNLEELSLPMEPMVVGENSIADLGRILFGSTTQALQETLGLLNYDDYKKAVKLIRGARTVYLFGVGASALAALDLAHKLNRIGKPCVFFLDGHTNLEFASVAAKRDVVIALSYSGETKEVCLAAQAAAKNTTPVISITRDQPSTLSECSTIVFRLAGSERLVRTGAFSSKFSQIFMTDLLYLGLMNEDYDAYKDILLDTSRVVRGLKE